MNKKQKNQWTHANLFLAIAKQMDHLAKKSASMRELFAKMGPGKYEDVTVYRVAEHSVRAHTRRSYIAVRVNLRKPRIVE